MQSALPELEALPSDGGVARLYRLPGAQGSRLRLTADGKLKPCLHSGAEYSLKGLDYDGMLETIRAAILAKPAWHGELSAESRSRAGRCMNQIGG